MKHTTCGLCSSGCPVLVKTENGLFISAERKAPPFFKKGIICPKLRAAKEIIYSPDRVKTPLIKNAAGIFKPVSWDGVLDKIAETLARIKKETGPESVCWLQGTASDYGTPWDYVRRLMHTYGSPNAIGNGALCHVAREIAHVFTYGEMTSADSGKAKCILIFGKNDQNTNLGAFESIMGARRHGATLIVVDPVKTRMASQADIHLQIKPGCDGLLAFAMLNVILSEDRFNKKFVDDWTVGFDTLKKKVSDYNPENVASRIWVEPEKIRMAARLYADAKPACLIDGNGLDMHASVFDTTRAVCMLRAITGNLGRAGGDRFPGSFPTRDICLSERVATTVAPVSRNYPIFNSFSQKRGDHTLPAVIDAILEKDPYPIRALFIQASNPVVTIPDSNRFLRAAKSLDLMVVIDPVMTRTAKMADIVLPATTSFEKTQLNLKYMSDTIILQNQVIDWVADSRPDWKIIFDLAKKMGFEKEFPWSNAEDAIDFQLAPSGICVSDIRNHPNGLQVEISNPKESAMKGYKTVSGKIEFYSETLREKGFNPIPDFNRNSENNYSFYREKNKYPLIGISGSRPRFFVHSQFRHIDSLRGKCPEPFVEIHKSDCQRQRICDRELIQVETPIGSITMKARMSDKVRPGLIRISWGWGEVYDAWNLNRIMEDKFRDPLTATPGARSFMCRIVRTG